MTEPAIQVMPYSETDIEDLATIHLAAFSGYMNSRMGRGYVKKFLLWFLTYPNAITLKATRDGKASGYVVGAPVDYAKSLNRDLLAIGIFSVITHPGVVVHPNFVKAIFPRLRLLLKKKASVVTPLHQARRGVSLIGIAVDPQQSGHGIGTELMKAFEIQASVKRMDYMALSVYDYNEKARAVYEKLDWKVSRRDGTGVYYEKALQHSGGSHHTGGGNDG